MSTTLADELATTFLFERLTAAQVGWIADHGEVVTYDGGATVYREGEPGVHFYVLLDGGVRLTRRVGTDVVELPETTQRGVYAGATLALVKVDGRQEYLNSLVTTRPSRLFRIPARDFRRFMKEHVPMAVHLLEGLYIGVRNTEATVRQHEQLAALGSLSAGLAHELNNPASAGMRAASQLRERVAGMRHKLALLADGRLSSEDLATLVTAQERVVELADKAPQRSALEESRAEEALADWLDEHGVDRSWDIAAVFAAAGVEVDWVEELTDQVGDALLGPALLWLYYTLETESLMREIEDATGRISTLVGAVREYAHMDRAPFQDVNVVAGLDSTITLMSHKLRTVDVVREFAADVPEVPGYAGELNQVWTNLIDNAVQAMDGTGTLTIRVAPADGGVRVEFADTGPGIPDDVLPRIFEAFFTTKPRGQGSGLGLDIAHRIVTQRHGGRIDVTSRPGDTRFAVWLPGQAAAPAASTAAAGQPQ